MAQPERRVIVCNGDGSMLMNLGSLVTIAAQAPRNLVVIVLDNGVYEVTGAQPVPGQDLAQRRLDPDTGIDDEALLPRGGREDVAVGPEGGSGEADGQHGAEPNR